MAGLIWAKPNIQAGEVWVWCADKSHFFILQLNGKKKKSTKLKIASKSDFCQTTFADGC